MKRSNKQIINIVILTLLFSTSCSVLDHAGKEQTVNNNPLEGSSEITTYTEPLYKFDQTKEISILYPYPGGSAEADSDFDVRVEKIVEYIKMKYGIFVQFEVISTFGYGEEMDLRLSSGDNSDIYVANVNNSSFDIERDVIEKQYAADITDYVDRFYPEIHTMLDRDPHLASKIVNNGKIMAIPGCESPVYNLFALVIHKDLYDVKNKDQYLSLDETAEIFKELNHFNDSGYYGIANFNHMAQIILYQNGFPLMLSGFNIFLDNNDLVFFEETDLFIDAFEYAEKIYSTGGNIEERVFRWDSDWTDPYTYKNTSYAAAKQIQPAVAPVVELVSYSSFRKQIYYKTERFNQSYTVMPINANAPSGIIRYEPKYFISSSCNDIDAALVFLRCLEWDKDVYTMFRYGFENTDYTVSQDGMEINNTHNFMFLRFENPFMEPKLAHDFGLWNEFLSEFISSQSINKSSYEYEMNFAQLKNAVSQLNKNDPEAKELLWKRHDLNVGISSYIRKKTGSYNEYLRLYDLLDMDDLKDKIKENMDIDS